MATVPLAGALGSMVAAFLWSSAPLGDAWGGSAHAVLLAIVCDATIRAGVAALPLARTFSASEAAIVAQVLPDLE